MHLDTCTMKIEFGRTKFEVGAMTGSVVCHLVLIQIHTNSDLRVPLDWTWKIGLPPVPILGER